MSRRRESWYRGVWYFVSLTTQQVAAGHVGIIQRLFTDAINDVVDPRGACLFVARDDTRPRRARPRVKGQSSTKAGAVFFSPASIALVPHLIVYYHAHPGPPPGARQRCPVGWRHVRLGSVATAEPLITRLSPGRS